MIGVTGNSSHNGRLDRDSRNASRPASVPLNSTMPGTSTTRSTARMVERDGGAPMVTVPGAVSAGSQRRASTRPTAVTGTLTRKIAGHPANPTRNPPSGGPSAALTDAAMAMAPSAAAGALPCGSPEPARIMASPAG